MSEILIESLIFLSVFSALNPHFWREPHRWITETGQKSSVVMSTSYFCQKLCVIVYKTPNVLVNKIRK